MNVIENAVIWGVSRVYVLWFAIESNLGMIRDRSGGEGENEKSGLVFVASVAQRTERGVLYLPPVWCIYGNGCQPYKSSDQCSNTARPYHFP